jgi:hypothetical protein
MTTAITLGDKNRDMYLDRFGNIAMATDATAIAECMTQRLSTLLGELRFDKSAGVNYMETVFSFGEDGLPALNASMRKIALATPYVTGIVYFDMAIVNEQLVYELSVTTVFGPVVLQGN